MKVKELIEILKEVNQDKEVYLEYDTFSCVSNSFVIVDITYKNDKENGIHFCSEDLDTIKCLLSEGSQDPKSYYVLYGENELYCSKGCFYELSLVDGKIVEKNIGVDPHNVS